jgi:hypothetical protein
VLAALVGVAVVAAVGPGVAAADTWTAGPVSGEAHSYGVSAQLADGSIFVAGGDLGAPVGEMLPPNPGSTSSFSIVGSMRQERVFGAGTLLQNGEVLIAGGDTSLSLSTAVPATAELWSPVTHAFTATGAMSVSRQVFTLTTLPNGEALAVGGSPDLSSGAGSATAELYDPSTNAWTQTGSMAAGRLGHTATLLPDCRVLIVGDNPTAETYDYVTGAFSPAGSEGAFQRSYHTATLLANGDVLIAGGEDVNGNPLTSASVYDPATGTFTPTANPMSAAHIQGFAARLSDGRVLVGGGFSAANSTTPTDNVDIYDPASNLWSIGVPLPFQAVSSEAQSLNDGDVIVLGAGTSVSAVPSGDQTAIFAPGNLGPTVSPPAENCSDLTNPPSGTGGGGTSGGTGSSTGTGPGTGAVSGTATPTPITVKVRSLTANSSGRIKITISTTGAATVAAIATTPAQTKVKASRKKRPLSYGRAGATAGRAGTITLTITPSGPARSLLTAGKNLRVTIVLTFTPAGGARSVRTVALTVHGHQPEKRRG